MTVNYNNFFRLCVEHDIKPSFFYSNKDSPHFISRSTIYEMSLKHPISLQVIDRLCSYFKCQPCDIMEFTK